MVSPIGRQPGRTLWFQVAETLKAEIAASTIGPGSQLPTEPELMRRFGVSRFTIRQAMASLQNEGLVRVEQGKGSFVAPEPMIYDISRRTRYSRNLLDQGLEPGHRQLLREVVPANESVADALGIALSASVVHLRGLSTADGAPIGLADTYLDERRFGDVMTATSITAMLADHHVNDFLRAWTTIGARGATPLEAALLGIAEGAPVLNTMKLDVDIARRPLVYAVTVWRADLVTFRLDETEG